jgi:hypothetical protein
MFGVILHGKMAPLPGLWYPRLPARLALFGLFPSLTLAQTHARAAAVLVDEFNASNSRASRVARAASLDTGLLDLSKSTIVESASLTPVLARKRSLRFVVGSHFHCGEQ